MKFGTSIGIAVLTERVPNETLVLFVMFEMWMRVPELIESSNETLSQSL